MLGCFLPDSTNKFAAGSDLPAMTRTRWTSREHLLCHPSLDISPYIGATYHPVRRIDLVTTLIGYHPIWQLPIHALLKYCTPEPRDSDSRWRGAWTRLRRLSDKLPETRSELFLQLVVNPTLLSLTVLYSDDKQPTATATTEPRALQAGAKVKQTVCTAIRVTLHGSALLSVTTRHGCNYGKVACWHTYFRSHDHYCLYSYARL